MDFGSRFLRKSSLVRHHTAGKKSPFNQSPRKFSTRQIKLGHIKTVETKCATKSRNGLVHRRRYIYDYAKKVIGYRHTTFFRSCPNQNTTPFVISNVTS
jgi:hypothetical protein